MRVVVPFGAARPKTRLSPVLDPAERRAFAEAMLADVLDALDAVDSGAVDDRHSTVLADEPIDTQAIVGRDVPVTVDERSLTAAVDAQLPDGPDDDPVAVVMADLALATPAALERLFEPNADVVLVPGRGGGTNALVVRHPDFHVDYHGASIRDHREIVRTVGASVATVDSYRLSSDVDEPADMVEVLLHAEGRAAAWLREAGFAVTETDGRVGVERSDGASGSADLDRN